MSVKRVIPSIFLMKYRFIHYFVYVALCLFILNLMACSANPPHRPKRGRLPEGKTAAEFISDLRTRLNLTQEQETQIRPIIEKEFTKRHEIIEKSMGQGPGGMESLKNKMQELQNNTEKELEKILTQEQMNEYRKLLDDERQNMRKHRPGHRMPRI